LLATNAFNPSVRKIKLLLPADCYFLTMENYPITISIDKEVYHFEIGEYLHHDSESCKVKVFQNGKLVASFQPDEYDYLQICHNPGNLDEELLHLLADQIEAHHPHGINKDLGLDKES
jgi:hypothetical protein